jgi:hypothetical protein
MEIQIPRYFVQVEWRFEEQSQGTAPKMKKEDAI